MVLTKRWKLKEQGSQEVVAYMMSELGVSQHIANLLVQRNICTPQQAEDFFSPDINSLHSPFLMKDMDKVVERIASAITGDEKILIFGDFDVDGISAVSMLYLFFTEKIKLSEEKVYFYIPDRSTEGYGISLEGIEYAKEKRCSLFISLDCGIKDSEKILEGNKENKIDFIICDHHFTDKILPDVYAILNPKRQDCKYPNKELSACGICFKLIQAFCKRFNIPFEEIRQYLDLVTISIAADIVSITGENRILAYHGLEIINNNPCLGIEVILYEGGIKRRPESIYKVNYNFSKYITISDLVFTVAPMLNAPGRMGKANDSVKLLLSKTKTEAKELIDKIRNQNIKRKKSDKEAFEKALTMIDSDPQLKKNKTKVLYNSDWHIGILGIVASRLAEHYCRPTIVFTDKPESDDQLYVGSARSIKNFDLYYAIDSCREHIEHYGGHKFAAGLSVSPEKFEFFRQKFESIASEYLTEDMLIPEIEIDAEINFSDINSPDFFKYLKLFAPFGPDNMSPVFSTDYVYDSGYSRPVKNHLKLNLLQKNYPKDYFDAIAFGFYSDPLFSKIKDEKLPMKICYNIEENEWNGKITKQLKIKDIVIKNG